MSILARSLIIGQLPKRGRQNVRFWVKVEGFLTKGELTRSGFVIGDQVVHSKHSSRVVISTSHPLSDHEVQGGFMPLDLGTLGTGLIRVAGLEHEITNRIFGVIGLLHVEFFPETKSDSVSLHLRSVQREITYMSPDFGRYELVEDLNVSLLVDNEQEYGLFEFEV